MATLAPTIAQEVFFKKLTELQRSHDTTQTLAQRKRHTTTAYRDFGESDLVST
ncbi:MAG TPA: hypothetical protein VME69_07710 [Methylocella sp.]|nr:hypothetical protein [Methylocella sp.]